MYEHLVIVPGIELKIGQIDGLQEALDDPKRPVASIYSYDSCSKVNDVVKNFISGKAIFTQPAGIVKCAGAPQKIMWLALDHWKKRGLYSPDHTSKIDIAFATGLDKMFGVARYNETLETLRKERGVGGLFSHDLKAIEGNTAHFETVDQKEKKEVNFDMLHVVPPMGPHRFVAASSLSDGQGLVDVDERTLQHRVYANVWSAGDASSLPTSKTAAAITKQAPVLVHNLLEASHNKTPSAFYGGYTSCPIPTEYGKLLLAEFAYQGVPMETFSSLFDQSKPQRPFYYLKKDFFPWVYFKYMMQGKWAGPSGWVR